MRRTRVHLFWCFTSRALVVVDAIARIEAKYCVDPHRVYAAGQALGGAMAQRVACDTSLLAAVAAVGPSDLEVSCAPPSALPVLFVDDPSSDALTSTLNTWQTVDGCSSTPLQVFAQGNTVCADFQGCAAGGLVRNCTTTLYGDEWPGGSNLGVSKSTGIDASAAIADFFLAHPRN